jgi:anaerobic selenocysteine-containing dehydrogenase
MCEAHPPSVFRAIITGEPYPVKALLVSATNPINSYGDTNQVLEALRKVDFMVTCDYWMTPTAMLSNYVMPIACSLERPTLTSTYGCSDFLIGSQRQFSHYMSGARFDLARLSASLGQDEMWP